MNKEIIYLLIFIVYYSIATFVLINLLFNSDFDLTIVNTKTGEQKEPTNRFLLFYSLLWIITIPLSIFKGGKV